MSPTPPSSSSSSSPPNTTCSSSPAATYLSHPRFNQTYTFPASPTHPELQISYADVGRQPSPSTSSDDIPTVLFIPGMFATRFSAVWLHPIAERSGVRVVVVDRFGMGSSTDVLLEKRISTWLQLVPKLIAYLQIRNFALMSHSAGTIYALNTLWHCRDLLGERPYLALLAPWVHHSLTGVKSMQVASWLPTPIFSIWNQIPRLVVTLGMPALALSGTVFNKTSGVITSGAFGGSSQDETKAVEVNRRKIEAGYGLSRDFQAELDTELPRRIFGESTVGANREALLCLKKGPEGLWGVCDDYEVFIMRLVERERAETSKVKVRGFFAAEDSMIGVKGREYMDCCWKEQDDLDFESRIVATTDHDSVLQSIEVLESVFREVASRS